MRWGMANLDAVLEAVKFPARVADLDASVHRKDPSTGKIMAPREA